MDYSSAYKLWCEKATADPDLQKELLEIKDDAEGITDRFYKDLEFGTGGLRGVIGAGSNRMNVYTVGRATQGLADHVNSVSASGSVAIAYDSRIKSDLFARTAASVLAANGVKVHIYKELMPTPMLSFAVRQLGCTAGIVITASHNPAKYNGYKAYGPDGCQLTLDDSEHVLSLIEKVDMFGGVKTMDFDQALSEGKIQYIDQTVIDAYLDKVASRSVHPEALREGGLRVIYTPLHGTGNKPVRAILSRMGVEHVTVVPEQELPNGNFPTAPFPNPEIRQAFECALKLAETVQPDLLLATDPDCDRVGIAVRREDEFVLMTGNEVGALLLHYVLSQRTALGTMPRDPIAVKTIVSTDICNLIAEKYGCQIIDVLTGFKFIGEQIGLLEKKGEEERFVFGFEESYGYLAGGYVRDKDAVVASMLICEMAAFYKGQGKSLLDVMEGLYAEFGMFLNTQKSFTCEGVTGMERMQEIMESLRKNPPASIGGLATLRVLDYEASLETDTATGRSTPITLPKSNVLSYKLKGDAGVIIRPSGTEPKIKVYLSARGENRAAALAVAQKLEEDMSRIMGF
ncbi:MAG: phospho-sugar mutase [Clostridiales bacterium]|nr:phospho-sugar mutase [Clostridiales bacterium]